MPREQNAEADAITNGDAEWLNPRRQVEAQMGSLPFIMLPKLLARGERFYGATEAVNAGEEPVVKDPRTLRVRDPWDV